MEKNAIFVPSGRRFMRLPEVRQVSGLSKTQIYKQAKLGLFPSPVGLGGKSSGWLESEILGWVESRVRASRGATENVSEVRA